MTKTQIVIEPGNHAIAHIRTFDAPVDFVFKAWTEPELISQWWGPETLAITIDAMNVRPGGLWRYIIGDQPGQQFIFNGVYHAIVPSERVVNTFEFEGMPGRISLETAAFENVDGKTLITDTLVFQSVVDRDSWVASGIEEGVPESWDRLDQLLEHLKS